MSQLHGVMKRFYCRWRERERVSFNINRSATCLDAPPAPWPTSLRRYYFNPEIVGSSPGGAERQFYFFNAHFQCFNFCTWCALLPIYHKIEIVLFWWQKT